VVTKRLGVVCVLLASVVQAGTTVPTTFLAAAATPRPPAVIPPRAVDGPVFNLSVYEYSGDGYATATWGNCRPPRKQSAVPAYEAWSGDPGTDGGKSVSPDVTTVLTLTCSNGTVSRTLKVIGGEVAPENAAAPESDAPMRTQVSSTSPAPSVSLPPARMRPSRPFIPLDIYTGANAAAVARLRAQVDDVVSVTRRFATTGSYDELVRALNSGHYGYSATDSVVMYRLTGEQRYIQQAVRMVDLFVRAETGRINANQRAAIAGDSYLEVGHFLEQLALAYDYGYNLLTATQRSAWSAYAEQTLQNLWNPRSARWGASEYPWTGWSIDDPGNNYHYSFLKATMLWAAASQSPRWIEFLQTRKLPALVGFFAGLPGGGTREGTGYGTAVGSLFENYAYWKGAAGVDLAAQSSHARETLDYWIHATVPTFDYFASIGDQSRSAMPLMFDYQRKLVALGVALDPTSEQARRGTWWLKRVRVNDGGSGFLTGRMRYNYNYRYDLLAMAASELAPTALVHDAKGTGALFARSDWSTNASWMHTVAGPYDQSHAHQDQGSFSFYKGGWLTLTSNVWSRSGIEQGVDVHNVLRFGSLRQRNSISTRTVSDSAGTLTIAEDLSPAYAGTQVSGWRRTLTYDRAAHQIDVHDVCQSAVAPVWQLHTPVAPVRQADGSYRAGRLQITTSLPASPTVNIVSMAGSGFTGGYRLEISGPGCEFRVSLRAL